jgi:hypothetical protein
VVPRKGTFLNAYKVLSLSMLPSKMKETTFWVLNRTIWIRNKAFKSGLTPYPTVHAEDVKHQNLWNIF